MGDSVPAVDAWLQSARDAIASAGRVPAAELEVTPAQARTLLDLARVAAHTQERRFAPLASFVTGIAVERMRQAGGPADPEAVAELIREITSGLESEPASL